MTNTQIPLASSAPPSAWAEASASADTGAVHPLSRAPASDPQPELSGDGFTYRHDWGARRGQWKLQLNWGEVGPRSQVFVAIGEGAAGGADAGKIVGSARVTVHNVAPRAGGVDIWVDIEWSADVPLYVDYLVVNP